ncbi:MAG: hypothetical protein KDD47_01400 [Acidobacteria bacterium]|nr:hypothetical protein [Acidobacteriota bacterium]
MDGFEKGVRFGCGAIFGAVLGLYLLLGRHHLLLSSPTVVVSLGASALVCGFLAMKLGDRFWLNLDSVVFLRRSWWLILLLGGALYWLFRG